MLGGDSTAGEWETARQIVETAPATYWLATVRPDGRPPPYDVYEVTPRSAFGLPVGQPFGPTRWQFEDS
jgi:hypothetical protein